MFWYTHILFAMGLASFFTLDPIVLALAGFLAVIPDLDKPFGHRKWFSHSIYIALILSIVGFLASFRLFYAFVVFLSIASHVILDFFTKSGVPILHPLRKNHYGLRLFAAHNRYANRTFSLLGLFLILFNLWLGYPL
jgi:inner membrane protein